MDELTPAPIDKVGLALIREARLLLARNDGAEVFQIPGGKVEPGDADDRGALQREIREELGLNLDVSKLEFLGHFSAEAAGKANRLVQVKLFGGDVEGDPAPKSEIAELLWLAPFNAKPPPVSAVVGNKILPLVRGVIGGS